MKLQQLNNSPSFKGHFLINTKNNKHIEYLPNYLWDLVKKEKLSAKFTRDFFELNTATKQQEANVQKKLNEICANFIQDGKLFINKK